MYTKKNILLSFMICASVSGFFSLYLGQDLNYDLLHYHFYNGYALFNLKLKHDFFAQAPPAI